MLQFQLVEIPSSSNFLYEYDRFSLKLCVTSKFPCKFTKGLSVSCYYCKTADLFFIKLALPLCLEAFQKPRKAVDAVF